MAQTGFTPILIYSSSTAAAAPSAGNLTNSTLGSELAINITDGKLFYKDNANAVQVIGWKTVPTTAGGTGLTSYTAGDLVYYASGTAFTKLAIGASGRWLGSSGSAPQWNAPAALTKTDDTNVTLTLGGSASTALLNAASLTLGWTGQLATTRGGTGLSSFTANGIVYASSTSALATGSAITFDGTNFSTTGSATATRFIPSGSTIPTNGLYLPAANTPGIASNSTLVLSVLKGASVALEGATTQTGVGITFPATQVASTNANTLDDYEEGTFSPVVRDNNGGNQATATTTVARYIKIGKMVYFDITFIDINTTGLTAANQIVITGLPFTSENTANTGPMVQVGRANVTATTGAVFGGVVPNATHMTLLNATTTGLAILPVSTITSGTGDLYLTGNYITSA